MNLNDILSLAEKANIRGKLSTATILGFARAIQDMERRECIALLKKYGNNYEFTGEYRILACNLHKEMITLLESRGPHAE